MVSTHVLDTSLGFPAQGVTVTLEKKVAENWKLIEHSTTNSDGRIVFNCPQESGLYRLTFQLEDYFKRNKITPFFTDAPVTFHVTDTNRKYHVPLLLNPFGYSTYRGS